MTENVVQDDENQDPVEAYDCDPSNYEAIAMCSQIVHTEPSHEDLSQDCAWKYCDYEENSISGQALHQELLYGGINNEDIHNKYETYRQNFECEDCDNKFPLKDDLEVHEETSHEEVPRNYWLNCLQEQYYEYYNYYKDCDEKADSTEDVIANTDNENLDLEAFGAIVM